MTKQSSVKQGRVVLGVSLTVLLLLLQGVSAAQSGAEKEVLIYKPQSEPATYTLHVTTHSLLETSSPRSAPAADHEDILTLSQRVTETDAGLLDVVLTVDAINPPPPERDRRESGHQYERREVVGNSQHTVISLLGEVNEATGLPHFASRNFYGVRGLDSVSYDLYRVILMLYPQFPLRLLGPGESWSVRDEVTLGAAEAVVAGVAPLGHRLVFDLSRRINYRLLGFVERKGYRTAHLAFDAQYDFEANSAAGAEEFWVDGSGEDTGEIYFAPDEGIVVEASITSKLAEIKTQGGELVRMWLDPKTSVFLTARGQRTFPLKWRSEKTISFELAGQR